MQNFGTKADDTAGPDGHLSAAEFNNLASENENAVLRAGLPLLEASEIQLATSLFLHGVKAEGFQDSGAANTYVATPISGASGVLLPADYAALNGAAISFVASNTNTTASTLNIGQTTGTLLGPKPIRTQGDTAVAASSITAGRHIQVRYNASFDGGNGAWVIMPWAVAENAAHGLAVFTAGGTWNVPYGVGQALVTVIGGGGGGGSNANSGSGGGGGGVAVKLVNLVGTSSVSVTIGAGGAEEANGGTSSFGAFCSATGGLGSTGGSGQNAGVGGTGVSGDYNDTLGPGYQRCVGSGASGTNISGKGGGPGGGISIEGGTIVGNAGIGYGCGGGGGTGNAAGGAGKSGIVVVRW